MKIYEISNIFIFINWVLKNKEKEDMLIIYPYKKRNYYINLFKLAGVINYISDKEKIDNKKVIYLLESEIININKIPKNSNFITFNFDLLYFSKCNIIHEYLSKLYYFSLLNSVSILPIIKNKFKKREYVLNNLRENIYLLGALVENNIISRCKFNKLIVNYYKKTNCNICYQTKKTVNTCCNLDICVDCLLNSNFKKCCPICKKYNKIVDTNCIIPKYLQNYFQINKNSFVLNNHIINIDYNDKINNINLYFDINNFYFLNNKEINLYTII